MVSIEMELIAAKDIMCSDVKFMPYKKSKFSVEIDLVESEDIMFSVDAS